MKQQKSASLVLPGRYALLKRSHGVYSAHERSTGKRTSLRTKEYSEAVELINAMNQEFADRQHAEALARIFQEKAGRAITKVTWKTAMEECYSRAGLRESTIERLKRAFTSSDFASLRPMLISETYGDHLRDVLKNGKPTVAKFLRTLQCFALERGWLSMPLIPNRLMRVKKKKNTRAITFDEYKRLISNEKREEWRRYYMFLWHLGGAQSDIAGLRLDNFNKEKGTLVYTRRKTGAICKLRWHKNIDKLLEMLPDGEWLFPTIRLLNHKQRATEFWRKSRTKKVSIPNCSLHSFRVSWAERAAKAGLSIREAQIALGHKSEAVSIAYARFADIVCGPLPEGSDAIDWEE